LIVKTTRLMTSSPRTRRSVDAIQSHCRTLLLRGSHLVEDAIRFYRLAQRDSQVVQRISQLPHRLLFAEVHRSVKANQLAQRASQLSHLRLLLTKVRWSFKANQLSHMRLLLAEVSSFKANQLLKQRSFFQPRQKKRPKSRRRNPYDNHLVMAESR
jgi:hypothetical protein